MRRSLTGIIIALGLAAWAGPTAAYAQQDLIDNLMLLGRSETLHLPGVERVEERPEEKSPPSLHARKLEEATFHRPLESRLHPGESSQMDRNPSLMEEAIEPRLRGRRPVQGTPIPVLPEPAEADARDSATSELDDPGPRDGLTLDAAIARMIQCNRALATLAHEIPQARADTLTAGLRPNPIVFGGASGVPYGHFHDRPGVREFPIVVSYPLDLTGRRKARERVAQNSEGVIDARYRDEVRKKVDELQTAFVDVLAARAALAAARSGLADLDAAIRRARSADANELGASRLVVERDLTELALEDAEERLRQTRGSLALLIDVPSEDAPRIEPFGFLRVVDVEPPPVDVLRQTAHACRPDLDAQRISIRRAQALVGMEQSRRIRDTYVLYETWNSEVGQTNQGERSVGTWGMSVFAPLPLFDRNQGNIQRARLEVSKMHAQLRALEQEVDDELDRALGEFQAARRTRQRIETRILPAVIRHRDEAIRQVRAGRADAADYIDAQRDYNVVARHERDAVVRHRRAMLRMNTVVGTRIMP